MNKLNIAIFSPFISAGEEIESGIGVHYRDLALGLKESGDLVTIFHFPYDRTISKSWFFEGIAVHSIGIQFPSFTKIRGIGRLCNLIKFFDIFEAYQLFAKSKKIFSKYHSSKNFNILEASSNRGVAFGVSSLKNRPPIFTRVSTTMEQIFKSEENLPDLNFRIAANFEKRQILRSDHLVTHTQNHASEVSKLLKIDTNRFKIIPHGIYFDSVLGKEDHLKINNSIVNVLFVGRLDYRKGFDILLDAIPIIIRKFSNIHFDICGTGEMLELANSKISDDSSKYITLHGYQSRDSLNKFYKNCDIFVAPSRYESFGLVYLEAMKFSKPIVACNSGGTPEVVHDEITGLLVDPGNRNSLTEAIVKLAQNPELRQSMGKSGRKSLENSFSMKTLIDKTREHYLQSLCKI